MEINKSFLKTRLTCPSCLHEEVVKMGEVEHNSTVECPECGESYTYNLNCFFDYKVYSEISPVAFAHPLDRRSILTLRTIPGFEFCMRKMIEYGYEKFLRVNAMADDVKVTSKTCSYIHDMVVMAAKIMDIEIPDVYINQNPIPNAWTIGVEFPLITINSGLIELLNEDELFCVIAHEVTHIKCHHVLYHMLAEFLKTIAGALGVVGNTLVPLNLALFEWSRKSELTADRGALIISNNKNACVKMLMKLAGGSHYVANMINHDEFIEQAKQFQEMTKGLSLSKFYRVASTLGRTHPFPVLRAYELAQWADSEDYFKIFNGEYPTKETADEGNGSGIVKKCPHCGYEVEEDIFYCIRCGQIIKRLEDQYGISPTGKAMRRLKDGVKTVFSGFNRRSREEEIEFKKNVCPVCKSEYYDESVKFCPNDGSPLISEQAEPPPLPRDRNF